MIERSKTVPSAGIGSWRQRALAVLAAPLTYPLNPAEYLRPAIAENSAVVEGLDPATAEAMTVTLRPQHRLPVHQAGQFIRFGVDIDGVRHWRCYSISSAPERADGCLTITVKAIDGGRVSHHVGKQLSLGERVYLEAPAGEFVLPPVLPERLLFITAGSGITPVMSMLASLEARGSLPQITLIHSAPDAASMIFADALLDMAARNPQLTLHCHYTRTQGRLDLAQLQTLCPDWQQRPTWACGPDAMLQMFEDRWQQAGVAEQLHVERFRPRAATVDGVAQTGTVRFGKTGTSVSGRSDQNVLELAELNGLSPEHGCRMGICHGCTVTLKSGCVRDLRNGQTFAEEGDLVQICVCAPVGDIEISL
ncbi:MAG TPA: ferredoxin reductase [Fontimonas sp.]